jgi:hypothetical protein
MNVNTVANEIISGLERDEAYRIADLREVHSVFFDDAIELLSKNHLIALYQENNGSALTAKDKAGAYFAGGEPRHILYLR